MMAKSLFVIICCLVMATCMVGVIADSTEATNESKSNELNNEAYSLQKSGKFDEALLVVDQAIEQNPKNNYAWGTKASILMNLNRYDEALIAIDEALKLIPDDPTYLNMKSTIEGNL